MGAGGKQSQPIGAAPCGQLHRLPGAEIRGMFAGHFAEHGNVARQHRQLVLAVSISGRPKPSHSEAAIRQSARIDFSRYSSLAPPATADVCRLADAGATLSNSSIFQPCLPTSTSRLSSPSAHNSSASSVCAWPCAAFDGAHHQEADAAVHRGQRGLGVGRQPLSGRQLLMSAPWCEKPISGSGCLAYARPARRGHPAPRCGTYRSTHRRSAPARATRHQTAGKRGKDSCGWRKGMIMES